MNIYAQIVSGLFAFIAFCISFIKFIHFFQLNSYRSAVHAKWLKANVSKYAPNLILGITALISSFYEGAGGLTAFCASMLAGGILSKPQKAKKPLVYTMRVRRLIITTLIIYIALYIPLGNLWAAAAFVLCPAIAMLSNLINTPVERCISNYYVNDAKKLLASSNAKVIGITGSYGKTSVKYYLATLLKAKYNVLMTPESYNTPMGIVKTIRSSLNAFHEIFICEMGAKRVGEIKEICDIVHPGAGIITSVGPQHLETFKSLDNVKKTKFELADSLPCGGMLFLNGDDTNISEHKGSRDCITYGIHTKCDYNASEISVSDKGTQFTITAPNGEQCTYTTSLIGMHNVLNITGAVAVSHKMGIDLSMLKAQVARLQSVPHRLELVRRGNDIIIDDAYNSNPSGTRAALETLSYFEGMKILLTPGMVELGERQYELNKDFGANASEVCDYVILVGRAQTQPIYDGLRLRNFSEDKIYIAQSFDDAINHAYSIKCTNTRKIILLENDLPDNY